LAVEPVWKLWRRENLLPPPGKNPDSSAVQLVAQLPYRLNYPSSIRLHVVFNELSLGITLRVPFTAMIQVAFKEITKESEIEEPFLISIIYRFLF
jgi:hypothetical protein